MAHDSSLRSSQSSRADIRKRIHDDVIRERFETKGGVNFKRLSGFDLQYIFNLYDDLFFSKQICKRLSDSGSQVLFFADARSTGVVSTCRRDDQGIKCIYYFDLSPTVLVAKSSKLAAGIGCTDRTYCLLLIMEYLIVLLLMMLYDYLDPEDPKFSEGGDLFKCILNEYFGHTRYDPNLGLIEVKYQGRGVYTNVANSCYIDSMLIVLFYCMSTFWRKGLLDTNVRNIQYETVKGICDVVGGSKINTVDKLYNLAEQIQSQLIEDYKSLKINGITQTCSHLRNLIVQCLPSLKSRGGFEIFNAGAIYDTIASIFPVLKFDIPYEIVDPDGNVKTSSSPISSLTMLEFMEPQDKTPKKILWNKIESPILVFINTGAPRIKKLNEVGEEKSDFYVGRSRYVNVINKVRAFGERILNGRYRIIGIVTLLGVAPNKEGGSHYIARYIGEDGQWYYYNDVGGVLETIDELPEAGVWKESGGQMPGIYFYERVHTREYVCKGNKMIVRVIHKDDASVVILLGTNDPFVASRVIHMEKELQMSDDCPPHILCWKTTAKISRKILRDLQRLDPSLR